MAIEVGSVLNGTVSGITKFGAFIDLGDKQTGLVHISEVAHGYVEDINDVLKVQDAVKVKVLSVDGSKIGLSIRQTQEKPQVEERRPERRVQSAESFEAKMKSFLRDSNERLHDLKRNTEGKRGGRGGRRD
ncbi:S1 domain-containing RNA-binding protein [Veillonella tobetsuensis]|uniref:RNA-binding protein S1 n=1 Tax=Veillonella tobetsuensis TaxID=1110546 RepID=A0A480B4T9_9FIRM|nr:S1 domain-containing RNA-binding protein [Veillonella tobetsuensis]GCL67752.1 RNA-binding protein S1 [Veillonella tobetsuensis]